MSLKFSSSYKAIQIGLIDGTHIARSIYKRSKVIELIENILQMFNVVEKDYFGLYFLSDENRKWLRLNKKIWPQIQHLAPPYQLYFGMKFYPRDPILLQEEITTYLMYLQLKKDVIENRLFITDRNRAEMCAYILRAEGAVSSSESYLKKHRNFFVHIQRSSPELEAKILQILDSLTGMSGVLAEAKLIEKAFPAVKYSMEAFSVHSEARPSLAKLSLTISQIGITIYQEQVRIEVFSWTEIWNAGYSDKTFWFKIFRGGHNSKHKYILVNSEYCKFLWELFKENFKFYTKDHGIPPKVAWGRVAPPVNRSNLVQDSVKLQPEIKNPLALESSINNEFPPPVTEL
eukprot:gene11427-12618_t